MTETLTDRVGGILQEIHGHIPEKPDFKRRIAAIILALYERSNTQEWHRKPTNAKQEWFDDPKFCATALRKMVESCVSLHANGSSLYTDGERKVMLAAANHLDEFIRKTSN